MARRHGLAEEQGLKGEPSPSRRPTSDPLRYLALGGLLGPLVFAAVVIVCAALRPGYSHVTQFISELGETGAPHARLMNLGGFIAKGILTVPFGVSLAWLPPRTPSSLLAAALIVVYGFGITAAGVFSCDPGCPGVDLSRDAIMHRVVSLSAFAAAILALALWAWCFRARAAWRSLWLFSAISSGLTFGLLILVGASETSRTLTGVWQRLCVATLDLWCVVVVLRVFRTDGPPAG